MKNVRMWFKKGGAAKYISHLDLTHCMGRALKLSGLPIWYTQGFNRGEGVCGHPPNRR